MEWNNFIWKLNGKSWGVILNKNDEILADFNWIISKKIRLKADQDTKGEEKQF